MFDVMTANVFRRKNKRHNFHPTSSPNTPNLSPSPSKSRMLFRSTVILNRVATCVSKMCLVRTRLHGGRGERTAADLPPSDSSVVLEVCITKNERDLGDYSFTATGESRLLQSHCWEGRGSTMPVRGKSSLFSLSSDLVDCEVRRHPAYDNKEGHQHVCSSAKYRIAPDSDSVAGEELFRSGNTIAEEEGSMGPSNVDNI
eukprot:scaffold3396_cov268-Ochromonas_danica.AAC.8